MRRHTDDDKEITGLTAEGSALPFSRQSEPHPVVHTRRHADLQCRFPFDSPPSATGLAGIAVDTPRSGTGGASLRHRQKSAPEHDLAVAAACPTRFRSGSGFGSAAAAGFAALEPRNPNRPFDSPGRLVHRYPQGVLQIVAPPTSLTSAPLPSTEDVAEPEEITQNVGEITEIRRIEAREGLTIHSLVAESVVPGSLLGVRQDCVGLRRLLEVLLSRRISRISIRVVLHREYAVGLLDFVHRGIASDT